MPSFVVLWALMVAAMMVPSITPLGSRYLRITRFSRTFGLLGFTAGYPGVWTTSGVLAFARRTDRRHLTVAACGEVAAASYFSRGFLQGYWFYLLRFTSKAYTVFLRWDCEQTELTLRYDGLIA